jgi:hypothetical protein
MPKEHAREVYRLAEDEDLVNDLKRIIDIVNVPHLKPCEVDSIRMRSRPISSEPIRHVVGAPRDEGQHLIAELPALDMKIFGIPEVFDGPSLGREDAKTSK